MLSNISYRVVLYKTWKEGKEMNLISEVKEATYPYENSNKFADSFITKKGDYLRLDYLNTTSYKSEDCQQEKAYDVFFDTLDKERKSYQSVCYMVLHADCVSSLPSNILKFEHLTHLFIEGSRWSNLTAERVPTSVRSLAFVNQSNLDPTCILGMERLLNLEELFLDIGNFYLGIIRGEDKQEEETFKSIVPIPNLSSLKRIYLTDGIDYFEDAFDSDWKTVLLKHPLLTKIKDRVKNVQMNREKDFLFVIEINLE